MNKRGSAILILIGTIALLSLVYIAFYIINNRVWEHIGDKRVELTGVGTKTAKLPEISKTNTGTIIRVRDPFFPDEIKTRNYQFSFDQRTSDKIIILKEKPNDQFDTGLKIIRDNAILTITPVFEGAPNSFSQSVNPVTIANAKISNLKIHRIEPVPYSHKYYYVDDYKESASDCADMTPKPTACSFLQLDGMIITCEANDTWVKQCDEIFKSLSYQFVPNDVSDWKTYENTKFGFSLKLPPSWHEDKLRSNRERSGDDIVFNPTDNPITESHEGVSVDPANGKTSQEYLDMLLEHEGKSLRFGTIEVDGEQGKFARTDEFGITVVFVVHNGKLYTINSQTMIETGILATWKFLN